MSNPEQIIALAKSLAGCGGSGFGPPGPGCGGAAPSAEDLEFSVPTGFTFAPNFSTALATIAAPVLDGAYPAEDLGEAEVSPYYRIDRAIFRAVSSLPGLPTFWLPEAPEDETPSTIDELTSEAVPALDAEVVGAPYMERPSDSAGLQRLPTIDIAKGQLPAPQAPEDTNFAASNLTTYAEAPPTIPAMEDWEEVSYTPPDAVDLSPLLAALRGIYANGGWTPEEQRALTNDANRAIDNKLEEAVRMAAAKAAASGFFALTPGALEEMKAAAGEATEKKVAASQAVEEEAHKRLLALISAVAGTEISLDAAALRGYLAEVSAQIKMQRFNIQGYALLYNALVDLYNARIEAYNDEVGDYTAYLRAVGSQNDAIASDLDSRLAKLGLFNAHISAIESQYRVASAVEQLRAVSEENKQAYLDEAEAKLSVATSDIATLRSNIQMLGRALEAYGRQAQVDSTALSAAAAGTQARVSGVDVIAGNAQLAQQAEAAAAGITRAEVSVRRDILANLEAQLGMYREYLGARRAEVGTATSEISDAAGQWREYLNARRARATYVSAVDRANVALTGAQTAAALTSADVGVAQQSLEAQAQVAQGRIQAGLLGAQAVAAAGLAQSALGITNVNLRMSGSTDVSSGTSDDVSERWSDSAERSWRKADTEATKIGG